MSNFKEIALKPDFGIEDFLKEGSKVLYENVFSTQHIGREMDFFLFEAKEIFQASNEASLLEFRFRNLLESGMFCLWRNYRKSIPNKCVEIEVGWDGAKIAISISASIDDGVAGFVPGAAETPSNEGAANIRSFLERIQGLSDGMCVRFSPRSKRIQIISLLNVKTEGSNIFSAGGASLDYVEITADSLVKGQSEEKNSTKPEPLALANVEAFIADEKSDHNPAKVSLAAPPAQISENDWLKTISSDPSQAQDEKEFRFKSEPAVQDETVFKVGGQEFTAIDELQTVVSTGFDHNKEEEDFVVTQSSELTSEMLKSELVAVNPDMTDAKYKDIFEKATRTIRENFLQTLEHLKAKQKIDEEAKIRVYQDKIQELGKTVEMLKAKEPLALKEAELRPILGDDDQSSRVADSQTALMKEKAELNLRMRDFEALEKRRQFEFKNTEATLKKQITMLEENLKQRDHVIVKIKEALASSMSAVDKLKTLQKSSDKNDLASKVLMLEKTLEVAQENSDTNFKKFEDLQLKWKVEMSDRANLMRELQTKTRQIADLQKKLDSAHAHAKPTEKSDHDGSGKVVDHLKTQVRQLQDKLTVANANLSRANLQNAADSKRSSGSSHADVELKHRYEQSMKMVRALKDEVEKVKKKHEELRLIETKLKVEVAKLQGQLKTAQKK